MSILYTFNKILNIIVLSITLIILISCDLLMPEPLNEELILNKPIDGLSSSQLALHLKGDVEFARIFSKDDGLGPIFVNISCESCHASDGKGHPFIQLTRFGRMKSDGSFDPMLEYGGPQLQQRAIVGYPPEEIPGEATGSTILMPPAVVGLGFLEAVHDSTILALADFNDRDGDGISGVPNYIVPGNYFLPRKIHIPSNGKYIGRFGRKAATIDLLQQITEAYRNDIGITSGYLNEDLYNYKVGKNTSDDVEDPEISDATVDNVVFYLKTLSPPPRRDANNPDVVVGEEIFRKIGCTSCHLPKMKTDFSEIEALSNKEFYPYTDLLLHDMGSELDDNYTEGTAKTNEWRTAPLWGIGLSSKSQGGSTYYLHDGRAKSLLEAIEYHGGEASIARSKFRGLTNEEKDKLYKFLMSL